MDNQEAAAWLVEEWGRVLEEGFGEADPEIDALVNIPAHGQSIRYAIVTQILGKIADPQRSLLRLQQGSGEDGAWDARGFCAAVVVPWEAENQNVLGGSSDPYVSNPLRVDRLTRDGTSRPKQSWKALFDFLEGLDDVPADDLKAAFRRVLGSLARRLQEQTFTYPIPGRISPRQLEDILAGFLEEASQGLRPLAVASAIFKVLGEAFSLFTQVDAQGLNEADAASGVPGDVLCYREDALCLAVEVKGEKLTYEHVMASVRKVREYEGELSNLLFIAPGILEQDQGRVASLVQSEWGLGLSIGISSITMLSRAAFMILDEEWRISFLREIGRELDGRSDLPARRAWRESLDGLS